MRFPLDPVLRYRQHLRDLRRAVLAEALEAAAKLAQFRQEKLDARAAQHAEVAALGTGGRFDVRAAAARQYHAAQLASEVSEIERQAKLVDDQVAVCRRALARADADVKAVETLRDKALAEHERKRAAREQLQLEDQWMNGKLTPA